jgi:SAM-dependent methyltransferase
MFAKYPDFDLRGKSVLEIGCGTGGRSAYLASQGAGRVVAIDINRDEIEIARRTCPELYPQIQGVVDYLSCCEDRPLEIGEFDVVVMVDCMEHVVSPPAMMRLAHGYTRPGGQFFFSNYGYYHHAGSHTELLPFVNLFFSDETILNVIRRLVTEPDYEPTRFDSDPPLERWRGLYDLRDRPGEHLNKLTLRDMKKLVRHSIFSETRMTVIGFGGKHPVLRLIDGLRHLPVIQEAYHSLVVVECRK